MACSFFWEQPVLEGVKTHATKSTVTLVMKVVAKSIKALNLKGTKTTKEKKNSSLWFPFFQGLTASFPRMTPDGCAWGSRRSISSQLSPPEQRLPQTTLTTCQTT